MTLAHLHEMGHVLGLEHENIRTDKNTYVTVLTNNISPPSNISWFTIDPTGMTNGPYDFESVMHLANNFSSVDPANLYTQVANPGYERFQPFMGNLALSAGDRAAVAYLYGPPTVLLTCKCQSSLFKLVDGCGISGRLCSCRASCVENLPERSTM
jgi:hypothetical protein